MNDKEMRDKVHKEIKILNSLKHPHIIRIYDFVEVKSHYLVIMEYAAKGELYNYLQDHGKVSEIKQLLQQQPGLAQRFFQQLICGIEYCHMMGVSHRDIKPENILLDQFNNIKIADFGFANIMNDGRTLLTPCGSPNYASPEILKGE